MYLCLTYNTQFEETIATHSEIAESLRDFTYYNNADCHYNFTFLSLPHMLTGADFDCSILPEEWKIFCWHEERSSNFYYTFHSLNYECNLYSQGYIHYVVGPIENLTDIFDNTNEAVPYINYRLLYVELEKIAIYKYVPYIIKPRFEVTDKVIHEIAFWDTNEVPHENGEFYQALVLEELSVDTSLENKFSVIHLMGLHDFWHINSDGTFSEEITGMAETSG